jgi:predicted Zn-dependent protease
VVIDPGPACRRSYDLQSVATHEFGHALGLGHVSNPSLTMHHFAPYCSTAPRTLGRGDVRGLRALYGLG